MTEPLDIGSVLGSGMDQMEDQPSLGDILNPKEKTTPLDDIEYTGSIETDALAESDVLLKTMEQADREAVEEVRAREAATPARTGFKERAARERKRSQEATDGEFYMVPVFQTGDQKFAFLEAIGLHRSGAKNRRYVGDFIPGEVLVKAINRLVDRGQHIEIPPATVSYQDSFSKVDKKLEKLT